MCGDCYAAEQWYEFGEEIEQLKAERDRIKAERAQADAEGHLHLTRARNYQTRLRMLRELALAIRETSHCSHLATDILTILDEPIEELVKHEAD